MDGAMVLSIVWMSFIGLMCLVCIIFGGEKKPKEESARNIGLDCISRLSAIAAMFLSWSVNQSVWWAVVHSTCGGFYLAYYWLGYGR